MSHVHVSRSVHYAFCNEWLQSTSEFHNHKFSGKYLCLYLSVDDVTFCVHVLVINAWIAFLTKDISFWISCLHITYGCIMRKCNVRYVLYLHATHLTVWTVLHKNRANGGDNNTVMWNWDTEVSQTNVLSSENIPEYSYLCLLYVNTSSSSKVCLWRKKTLGIRHIISQ